MDVAQASIERPAAGRALFVAINQAAARIERNPKGGLPAPRAYPSLAAKGEPWMTAGRCWIVHATDDPPVILGVFFETVDIPGRF